MSLSTSWCSAISAQGSSLRRPSISFRFLMDPSKFPKDEGMNHHFAIYQRFLQLLVAVEKVVNPNRRINKYHADRLLGIGERFFSVPPRLASRLALSFAIRACSPRRTKAVFSDTPVSFFASRSKSGSMLSVVLICIMMHLLGISVKRPNAIPRDGRRGARFGDLRYPKS